MKFIYNPLRGTGLVPSGIGDPFVVGNEILAIKRIVGQTAITVYKVEGRELQNQLSTTHAHADFTTLSQECRIINGPELTHIRSMLLLRDITSDEIDRIIAYF